MGSILSVNLGVPRSNAAGRGGLTGIDKRPADGPVAVHAPDRQGDSGLAGDRIFDTPHHGGPDQAVYAYAREDLDAWSVELGRPLSGGTFGENLTTTGIDVTGVRIGERWRVGDGVELEASVPRIPCRTFAVWMAEQGWIKRFTEQAWPGAYFRVIAPGTIRAGDPVTVLHRPDHDVDMGLAFRALTTESDLLPRLLGAPALPADIRAIAEKRVNARR